MSMLRFVILQHEWDGVHWDLMIEATPGGSLRTWAIDQPITREADLPARPLAAHRRAYLDYEGEVSGGRGTVTRFDAGFCRIEIDTERLLVVELQGIHLTGRASLRTTSDDSSPSWVFRLGN